MNANEIGDVVHYSLTIQENDRHALLNYHQRLSRNVPWAALSGAAASFLLIGALIVIFSVSLLFTLPNVNVIQSIILPGYLPAGSAILLSIPLIVASILIQRKMNQTRKEWMDKIGEILNNDDEYGFKDLSEKKQVKFIEKNFFPFNTNNDYKEKLISDIKAKHSKGDKDPLAKALDRAKKNLYKKKTKN
ncbi:MAG: hypothetical protein KDK55_02985 [Chlamydiia bacterium]|nr:hypothetical protein [Chlamydiia bacterium]